MGNLLNKEWSPQIDSSFSDDDSSQANSQLLSKSKNSSRVGLQADSTPITNKVIVADFDPRSPTNGIVRTPICYVNENSENKKQAPNGPKFSIMDPRSPTSEYSRTPIHINTVNKNDLSQSNDYLDDSSSSLDSSGLTESSILLQQVPENIQPQVCDSPSQYGLKLASSNMPRHILQRKQMDKLNKKKLIDYQENKENN